MKSLFIPFPLPLTGRQWFYLGILQGLGAGIIDGGANFGIAYAMYHKQKVIKMWVLAENTLAGDLGVTPIIQCLASMLITSTLVHTDLHHKGVAPLSFVWPHVEHLPDPRLLLGKMGLISGQSGRRRTALIGGAKHGMPLPPLSANNEDDVENQVESREDTVYSPPPLPDPELVEQQRRILGFRYYPFMLLRFIFEGTESNILLSTPVGHEFSLSTFLLRVLLTAAQGAALGIVCGLPIFLIFIVVLGRLYGHENVAEKGWKWAPMVIKAVYGAVVGWITNPIIAAMALGSQAQHHLITLTLPQEQVDEMNVGQAPGVTTIEEEGEEQLEPPSAISQSPAPRSPLSLRLHAAAPSSPISLPPTLRARASSSLSSRSRPPLTADASTLPLAPPLSPFFQTSLAGPTTAPLPSPGRMEYLAVPTPPRTAGPTDFSPSLTHTSAVGARPRGASVSSIASSGAWSYALGGTGGRAQRRPRASTSSSARPSASFSANASARPSMSYNTASGAQSGSMSKAHPPTTPRSSYQATSRREDINVARRGSAPILQITGRRSSVPTSGTPPVWDVFGRVEGTQSPPRSGLGNNNTTEDGTKPQ